MAEHKKNKRPSSQAKHDPGPVTGDCGQSPTSRYDAALHLMRSKSPDADMARRLLEEAIADDDPRASYALATWYLHGTNVRKNTRKGVRLLQAAADRKVPDALFDLAVLHERGRGVAKNEARAFALYMQAAEQGDHDAMSEVGRMLYHGIGVAEDRAAADRWLERAEAQPSEAVSPARLAS